MKHSISMNSILWAAEYWKKKGFDPCRVPMCVSDKAMSHTAPVEGVDFRYKHHDETYFVASAEQSFLQMDIDGEVFPGEMLMALTPCFRSESDSTHYSIFLKLELFAYARTNDKDSAEMEACEWAFMAKDLFYNQLGLNDGRLKVIDTDIGFDLMYGDLELGSYGGRISTTGRWYVYGTGIAEPRYSMARDRYFELA
ncbi:putative serine tRNA ligase [Salmonella phage SSBI34]|nr:putative serine tRNA ligase [Salmonella phage SSBI34]